jgi:hypothetical protein
MVASKQGGREERKNRPIKAPNIKFSLFRDYHAVVTAH